MPLLEDGGIEAFIRREVLPYTPDAWIKEDATKIGYEVSFTRHFYKPQPLRTLEEISADILAIEKEAEGLLAGDHRRREAMMVEELKTAPEERRPGTEDTRRPCSCLSESRCEFDGRLDQFIGCPTTRSALGRSPERRSAPEKLRPRIEPWLTALVQSEHLSLLVGSGLSHAVHRLGTGAALPGMNAVTFQNLNAEITQEAKRTSDVAGREEGNFEDQIRVANELLRGLEILAAAKEVGSAEQEQVASTAK